MLKETEDPTYRSPRAVAFSGGVGGRGALRVKEDAHRVDERHDAVVGAGWSPLAFEMADRALSGDPNTIYFPAAPLQCERNLG
ncbi:hypothetical protein TNIN_221381 [Trichonephila inaurata madagascariensis]|uniref:Uncharacterized protein n=1 Tax=Trichonephila inaurata madagascariensis TaxID=2747483 RepID=A0A8X6WQS6_9ARAC|nr:hypothetical protein TNIN_221381 [Trichonephila inaurata madagascariensis]